jgi:NodT family efflux transporter outer membrane factor (OMF) lipoprotein
LASIAGKEILDMKVCILAIALLFGFTTGCTTVGPDYEQLTSPKLPSSWSAADVEEGSRDAANWWKLFRDPILDDLIDRGARQNLGVEAAGLRIVQARAALGISDALIFPQQQKVSGNLSKVYQNEHSFNSAGIGLDVGWEMDIWGKYARGIEVSEANLYASIASYRDVLVTITAEIARNYINYRTAQERTYLSRQNIAIQQRVVEMTQTQFDSGNVTELDVQQSKTQLYGTQAALPVLSIARLQARNAIAVLLGVLPEDIAPLLALEENESPSVYEERQNLPASEYDAQSVIPVAPRLDSRVESALVLRRPDIQLAELQTRAQSARIGQAQAALYPQFFLFGSIGLSDTVATGDSFSASNAVTAAIGPGFSWNIFQYGRIKNQVRVEDARFQESITNYNQQVLQAVQEVSNALVAYQYSVEQSEYNFSGVSASIRAFNISSTQYNNGLVTYQRLLSTVEKMTLREDAYAVTRGNIANQVVALYKALGGGWEPQVNTPIVKPETVELMRQRSDWGDYLEDERLQPESIIRGREGE